MKGKDIICAAVSSAAYFAANTILDIIKAKVQVDEDEERGLYLCVDDEDIGKCQEILTGFRYHLSALSIQYPENIQVTDLEV